MKKFYGTGVALVTPFNEDKSVDYLSLEKLVNFQVENGINYLVVLGTTGEPATLSDAEKENVRAKIIEINAGRLPLVLGMGGNNTAAVEKQIKNTNLNPFDAILSVSPYYNKPTQEGIYQHFRKLSAASTKPIIIYNVPGRTASNIEPETVLRLASDFKNIIGIKEAAGNMLQAMRLLQNKPDDFLIISGDDMLALPIILMGGSGVISVIGQGLPRQFSELINLALKGDCDSAAKAHYAVMNIIDYIFEQGNPAGIKALLHKLSICKPVVRLPLVEATNELQQKINNFIDKY
jgi:4-hydroxy-tetrahydrodipicolinate synthase